VHQVALEVADQAMDREPRVLVDQLARALAYGRLGDVYRYEALNRERVQQRPRLGRVARAQLDQLRRARALPYQVGV
jgi:hypothetical protein